MSAELVWMSDSIHTAGFVMEIPGRNKKDFSHEVAFG